MTNNHSKCRYCNLTQAVEDPFLLCTRCERNVHVSCLRTRNGLPTGLLGDVFFRLVCADCSSNGEESISRYRLSWMGIVTLVLYNLHHQSHNSSRKGFFHWRIHICKFIQDKWKSLFPSSVRRKKSWTGTISGTLTHSPTVFMSGTEELGEAGWWRLNCPDLLPLQIIEQKHQGPRRVPAAKTLESNLLTSLKTEDDSSDSSSLLEIEKVTLPEPSWSVSSDSSEMYSRAYVEPSATLSDVLFDDEEVDVELDMDEGLSFSNSTNPSLIPEAVELVQGHVTIKTEQERPESPDTLETDVIDIKQEVESCSDAEGKKFEEEVEKIPRKKFQPMSQFEEVQLMHKLQRATPLPNAATRRLLRKLVVRHTKRQHNLPLFNIDYSHTGYTTNDPSMSHYLASDYERVLDRFQQTLHQNTYTDNSQVQTSFKLRLMGHCEYTCFHSPYTERLLKPFIMRESSSRSPWIKLMTELMAKANKNNPAWSPSPPATLDYSYVRPHHIAPVNSLCREFFWPGIDVTESLQYPDFTCVALYKKLVVGFAFLVPDVGYNESYISFLFVRPEWRRAGIASFMLYHLIQTCMGKDVTLHVSATNTAFILYQKFGFKVEEFVQDFYEKYLPIDSKECRHAFFLRLSR